MDDQPKAKAQSENHFFADGKTERLPVPGTVARGELFADASLHTGKDAAGNPVARSPLPVDQALRTRGAQRYAIYCQPCHAENGSGQSMLRERAGVNTADLTQERLVQAPDGYIFDVITHGFGLMPSYAYQVPVADRWAIIAHVRELQAAAAQARTAQTPDQTPAGGGVAP
jgi:mono/diheme cytochrome c family protein